MMSTYIRTRTLKEGKRATRACEASSQRPAPPPPLRPMGEDKRMSERLAKSVVEELKASAVAADNMERTLLNRDWICELREEVATLKASLKSLKSDVLVLDVRSGPYDEHTFKCRACGWVEVTNESAEDLECQSCHTYTMAEVGVMSASMNSDGQSETGLKSCKGGQ